MKYRQQAGVGLIEVLVTLLILSTSLLTLTSLQNRSLQFNQGAYFRSQANILAYDIFDRMRLNKANLISYVVAESAFSGGAAVTTPLAAADVYQWRRDIDARLPGGVGKIECVAATSTCTVTISWTELNATNLVAEDKSSFIYSARI